MTRALALFLLILAAAPARAQVDDDSPLTESDRLDLVERRAWAGILSDVAELSAMIGRLDAQGDVRMYQDSLVTVAVSAGAMRAALLAALQVTAARDDPDKADSELMPLAECALGLADLLGETAHEASQDAIDAGRAAPTLDGPTRAARLLEFGDLLWESTSALGLTHP